MLLPLSWVYGWIMSLRNILFDFKIFRTRYFSIPIISVGNITAGGTGKTPFVEYLVRYYLEFGVKVCVISRGYKRSTIGMRVVSDGNKIFGDAHSNGDEPQQISEKFIGVIVIVDEKRVRAVEYAIKRFQPSIIILDDAFQHRSLGRNIDIVMIDGKINLRKTKMIPAGNRRESLGGLRRADLLVFSNVSATSQNVLNSLKPYSSASSVGIKYNIKTIRSLSTNQTISVNDLVGASCIVFCGIGAPAAFRQTLAELKVNVVEFMVYPDHHYYTIDEIQNIKRYFDIRKAKYIITTEKDAMRLRNQGEQFPLQSCYFIEVEVSFIAGETLLHFALKEKIDKLFL
ncbi:MAG: tetraacyldisaccharide 4'-kinase [Ignavibacteriales bacterium]|nr:tetraacyldisaccharide 4'-kinase [Ignavibacteriales bacterium]